MSDGPRMYREFARWWPLISPPSEYEEEAAFYQEQLLAAWDGNARTLLELGCGGGNNGSFMKKRFEVVLVDSSPEMLDVSRALNPECEHVVGDMRTVRLGREFDCVFVQDAICYMTTEEDVRRALETAYVHCRPGGAALFAPDHVRETFRDATDCGGTDDGKRGCRYLEWTWDPDPSDSTYCVDYCYVMREADGRVQVAHDRHVEGLFGRDDWLRFIREAGFTGRSVPFNHSQLEPGTCEVFVAEKPR